MSRDELIELYRSVCQKVKAGERHILRYRRDLAGQILGSSFQLALAGGLEDAQHDLAAARTARAKVGRELLKRFYLFSWLKIRLQIDLEWVDAQ